MTIQIDKSIPAPRLRRPANTYPWKEMEVGDSFLAPTNIEIDNFRRAAYAAAKGTSRKFTIRQTHEGYRCWRVA